MQGGQEKMKQPASFFSPEGCYLGGKVVPCCLTARKFWVQICCFVVFLRLLVSLCYMSRVYPAFQSVSWDIQPPTTPVEEAITKMLENCGRFLELLKRK